MGVAISLAECEELAVFEAVVNLIKFVNSKQ
jgi:hypothetical protein